MLVLTASHDCYSLGHSYWESISFLSTDNIDLTNLDVVVVDDDDVDNKCFLSFRFGLSNRVVVVSVCSISSVVGPVVCI